jgi:hypothetical protein
VTRGTANGRRAAKKPAANGHAREDIAQFLVSRDVPCDLPSERGVLGTIFLAARDPAFSFIIENLFAKLRSSDFFDEAHIKLFGHLANMRRDGVPIDPTLIVDRLKAAGDYDAIGGSVYLSKLADMPNAAHGDYYADVVLRHSRKRRQILFHTEALRQAYDGSIEPDETANLLHRYIEADRVEQPGIDVLSAADLAAGDFAIDYHVGGVLARNQPCIVAAPQKTLKTTICLDLGLSIASGLKFLGRWPAAKGRVLMLSGESGIGTLQKNARAICKSKDVFLSTLQEYFMLSAWIPRFTASEDLLNLRSIIAKYLPEVLIVDPAYLCLPGDDAGNLFSMGEALRGISQLCQELKVTLVLVHHMRKPPREKFEQANLPELTDIAWSGFAEFARQWILMKRRKSYEPGTGHHELWFTYGGSAGHGGGWGLDIDEGPESDRFWSTSIKTISEVSAESNVAKSIDREQETDKRKSAVEEERRGRVAAAIEKLGPSTQTAISTATKLNNAKVREACDQLLELGQIESCKVLANGREYPGFRVVSTSTPTTPTDPDTAPTGRGESTPTRQGALKGPLSVWSGSESTIPTESSDEKLSGSNQ